MKNILILAIFILIAGCCRNPFEIDTDQARADILLAEKEFARMAADSGITEAFIFFADKDAAVLRGEKVLQGIDSISHYFESRNFDGISLEWTPDFVDVSASGDLGYTYGRDVYTMSDSTGQKVSSEGIFHTVWKKQPDGSWKFVWD